MTALQDIEGLSECIGKAIQEHLATANIDVTWPQLDSLIHPVLRVEAYLEDAAPSPASANTLVQGPKKVASRTLDLSRMRTPAYSRSPTIAYQDPKESPTTAITPVYDRASFNEEIETDSATRAARRKGTGGLRVVQADSVEDTSEHQRKMQVGTRSFPKRKKAVSEKFVFQPSTLDKLIVGIWEQVHGSIDLDPQAIFEQFAIAPADGSESSRQSSTGPAALQILHPTQPTEISFSQVNSFCRKVTQASRVCRSIEILVQARWIELFEEQIELRAATSPQVPIAKHRKAIFMEACQDFGWSEKELRNKTAIWRGYKEVKDAAGWAALVFSGMGIYRFCKYRVGFDNEAMRRLRNLRKRLEVAADTLHPHWRQLLIIVGESSTLRYPGHPHEWIVFEDGSDPLPLQQTYLANDPYFSFEQIEESIIDESVWGCEDPRWMPPKNAVSRANGIYLCEICHQQQSDDPKLNYCYCFPSLFGYIKRRPPLVQVFRTPEGKNNGLVALTSFDRGVAIGELVGLVTRGVQHLDVMEGSTPESNYQIWQGKMGNYTRFINHSCKANAQSSTFTWLDTQRVVLVSKGIDAGSEITLDYGDKYWAGLDKVCLCGESCCRYRQQRK